MKVVMISRYPDSVDSPKGGVESATVNLVDGLLARDDIELELVTVEKGRVKIAVEVINGLTVHRLPRSRWPMFADILFGPSKRQLKKTLEQLNPDLVHFQETWGLGFYGLECPHTMTVHGFDSLNIPAGEEKGWRMRSRIWRWVENFTLKRHKNLISIAPYVTDQIGDTQAQIQSISNAISRSLFSLKPEPVTGRIFFAGWIDRRKNLLGLLRVLKKLNTQRGLKAELFAAGSVADIPYKEEIDRYIQQNDLSAQTNLLGQLSQSQLREELRKSSVVALLSYQENAPMIISEAMALGIPVVCSNLCGMPQMVVDNERGFLVDPDNIEQCADQLEAVLTNMKLRNRLGESAQKYAREQYHPDAVAQQTVNVYLQLLRVQSSSQDQEAGFETP